MFATRTRSDPRINVVICMERQFRGATEGITARVPDYCSVLATDNVLEEVENAHVLIPYMSKLPELILSKGKSLRLVQQFGVGLEGVDVDTASKHDIAVCNIPAVGSGNDVSVAEHTLFLLLSLLRKAPELRRNFNAQLLGMPLGETLEGKRVVILGYGNVGMLLTRKLRALGASVAVIRQSLWTEEEAKAVDIALSVGSSRDTLQETMRRCFREDSAHILIIACPLTAQTSGVVDEGVLCGDRPIYVVNVARGAVIDQPSLEKALDAGKIAGLGLDVFWSEPFDPNSWIVDDTKHNVICTGHVGGHTTLANALMSDVVVDNIKASAEGSLDSLRHCVNRQALGCSESSVWTSD